MVDNETITPNDSYTYQDLRVPSFPIQFWTNLILEIPSILCTIYLLYHLLFNRNLRQQLHNHVIIILLFLCFIILVIDNSLWLDGYRMNGINSFPSSPSTCLFWWFIDYFCYDSIPVYLLWASFERHILIFHQRQLLNTKRKTFFIHYLPLILIAIYLFGFYFGVIIFPPCQNNFDFTNLACGYYPCYQDVSWLNTWDYVFNGMICIILEAFCSIALIVRTIWRKYYSQKHFQWKKYRKMIIQLCSMSSLFLSVNLPLSLINFVQQIAPEMSNFGSSVQEYLYYLTTFVIIFVPFVCLGCLPELWPKLFCFSQRPQRRIGPMTITIRGGPTIYK